MKVLVTGAGGFLGRHIVEHLTENGIQAVGLDRMFPPDFPSTATAITGSILDPDAITQAAKGVTGIIHAAGLAHMGCPGRWVYDRPNVVGTCRVLAEARRLGVRLVHISSAVTLVGRDTPIDAQVDETAVHPPERMLGRYARSKRQAELVVLSAVEAGVDALLLLPTGLIGPGDHSMTAPSAMIRDLSRGSIPALIKTDLNFVDVKAVAQAAVNALDQGKTGERYLLAGNTLPLDQIAQLVAQRTGQSAPTRTVPPALALLGARGASLLSRLSGRPSKAPLEGVRMAIKNPRYVSGKAADALGFQPGSSEAAISDTLEWLLDRESLDRS